MQKFMGKSHVGLCMEGAPVKQGSKLGTGQKEGYGWVTHPRTVRCRSCCLLFLSFSLLRTWDHKTILSVQWLKVIEMNEDLPFLN